MSFGLYQLNIAALTKEYLTDLHEPKMKSHGSVH